MNGHLAVPRATITPRAQNASQRGQRVCPWHASPHQPPEASRSPSGRPHGLPVSWVWPRSAGESAWTPGSLPGCHTGPPRSRAGTSHRGAASPALGEGVQLRNGLSSASSAPSYPSPLTRDTSCVAFLIMSEGVVDPKQLLRDPHPET